MEGSHKISHALQPEQSSDSIGAWGRETYLCSWRVSWGGGGGCGSLWCQGHWWQRPQGILIGMSSPGGCNIGTEAWPHLTTCSLQCWDALGQTTSREEHSAIYQSADRLYKVELRLQSPLNLSFDTALLTRWTSSSSTHQRAGISPSHQEACISPWTNLTHQVANKHHKHYNPAT